MGCVLQFILIDEGTVTGSFPAPPISYVGMAKQTECYFGAVPTS